MVVNEYKNSHIKFVSYTGKYPNLCSGILTLEIDGEKYCFGHNYRDFDSRTGKYKDNNFSSFWSTGGSCGFTNNYSNSYVNNSEWEIDINKLPEKFKPYALEIDQVFNENVEHGCCGGCL